MLTATITLLVCACDKGGKNEEDAGIDAGPDAAMDAAVDTDTETDTDTGSDTETDTDTEEDAGDADTETEPDAAPDSSIEEDAGTDSGPELGCVWFVDTSAGGAGTGLSWEDAFADLQDGIDAAKSDPTNDDYCQVWVAAGTYKPDTTDLEDPRMATFQTKSDVHVYGGFAPLEDASFFDDRNPVRYKTILSGDIQAKGTLTDNCYHVLTGAPDSLIDGFVVTGGYANGSDAENKSGAGMYNPKAASTVINVTFIKNTAIEYGGGMFNTDYAAPIVSGCSFQVNEAGSGGGMANTVNASPVLSDCEFISNTAQLGGGMFNIGESKPEVATSSFHNNTAASGGGMYSDNSTPTLTDTLFNMNKATSETEGEGGGAMYNTDTSLNATECTFSSNSATASGGAVNNNNCVAPVFTKCRFESNDANSGGGVYNLSSGVTVEKSVFWNNRAVILGGGMYSESSVFSLIGCTFQSNTSQDDGGGLYNKSTGSTAELANCVFANNSTAYDGTNHDGGGIYNLDSSPKITNCTFYGNNADNGGGINNYGATSTPAIVNSILWGNEAVVAGPQVFNYNNEPIPVITYSDVQGGCAAIVSTDCTGLGNIDVDPLFQNAPGGNLRLQFKSPCVDKGNDLAVSLILEDIDGNNRNIGNAVDIGADEMAFLFVDHEASGDGSGSSWTNAFTDLESALLAAETGYQVLVAEGTYKPSTPANRDATFKLVEGISIYGGFDPKLPVPDDAGVPDGGMDAGPDSGPPEPEATFADRSWTIHETILSGDIGTVGDSSDNSYHVVTGAEDSYIDGFIITEGNADGEDENGYGGGMINSAVSPTIKNTRFYNNSADRGGGMANLNQALPTLENCIVDDNSGQFYGGGMYNFQSSPLIFNSILKCNSSNAGGAMANMDQSSPEIINSTFQGNDAEFGGGIYNNGSFPSVTNSIIWGNTALLYGPSCYVFGNITYSDVEGICEGDVTCGGEGNIDKDPHFVDDDFSDGVVDLHITHSYCVDTGNNAEVVSDTDLDGNPRIVDGQGSGTETVDMGAYEYQGG